MPNIVNTFLKSKMNKDLDNRLVPNGEYRDANNLQISRSQGSEVGEFENILGNNELAYLYTGTIGQDDYTGKIIGQFTNETDNIIYVYSAGYDGNGRCPRDLVFTAQANTAQTNVTTIQLFTPTGQKVNAITCGVEVGMLLWGDNWNGQPSGAGGQRVDPIVRGFSASGEIIISQAVSFANSGGVGIPGDTINIGFTNTIHEYNINTGILTLLVRGSFLNFHKDFRIYGINLIQDLLFWTDNRNQPRKINVSLANPTSLISPIHYINEDQISVAKYYPYEAPLVLHQTILNVESGAQNIPLKGYDLTCKAGADATTIKIGDIVSGFPGQGEEELWNVIDIDDTLVAPVITIYNNFKDGDIAANMQPGTWDEVTKLKLKFSSSTMKNSASRLFKRGFNSSVINAAGAILAGNDVEINYPFNNTSTDPSSQPSPRVGDFITSETLINPSGVVGITIADEVVITSIESYTYALSKQIVIRLNKDIEVVAIGDDISVAVNPNFDDQFTGDPDLIEEKFIRFSYRFKFEDDEYSLAAPYTQICFIPRHDGYYGGGKNEQLQDMVNNYDSSIVEWFVNKIDTVSLNLPLPDGGQTPSEAISTLIDGYKVKEIEILYKESDALSTKILEVIDINTASSSFVKEIPITSAGIGPQWFYEFDYKSIKPYRTLPTSEQNRVYDNVPLKALGQEISANRVIYGNFLQKHTPPTGLNYEVVQADKSVNNDNYAQYPNHSVKQNRNYQVGFVLADRYGRASSVVLSTNDSNPALSGSTIYVPYKSWSDVGGPESNVATGVTSSLESVYSWLGNALRVKLNSGVNQLTNNELTGEPGLYKSEQDTSVDNLTINSGGAGYAVGDGISFTYDPFIGLGAGSGLKAEVVSETAGVVTGLQITDRGSDYYNGQQLEDAVNGCIVTIDVFDANPTGWQSYKLVVKQQEQDYYNVYLPGYVSGYPVTLAKELGRVAFAVLLGDNINKIPRDLNEVGPLQTEFSTSIKLFGRVNNPNINNTNKGGLNYYYVNREYPWNTQYFPGRINDEAVTVGAVGQGGLELANSPFVNGTSSGGSAQKGAFSNVVTSVPTGPFIPWGIPGAEQNFYNVEQNPLAVGLKVGAEDPQPQLQQPGSPQLNTLGAKVTGIAVPPALTEVANMIPFLSVSETLPVESQLEIFYESSTSGNFVDLNREVTAGYGGITSATVVSASFDEDEPSGTTIITAFSFTDSAGNELTLQGVPAITAITDGNGTALPGIFNIVQNGGTPLDFDIQTNQLFAFLAPSGALLGSNKFFISFTTTYNNGVETFVDNLPNLIEINLNNIKPSIGGFTPAYGVDAGVELACGAVGGATGYDPTMTGILGQFTNGVNGSADPTQNTDELCWSLTVDAEPVGSTANFKIDQCTGELEITGGTAVNGDYDFTATLTDAAPGCPTCTPSAESLTETCSARLVYGTPPTNQAICFGPTNQMAGSTLSTLNTTCNTNTGSGTCTGGQLQVFFTNSSASGATASSLASYIAASVDPSAPGGSGYNFNGGLSVGTYLQTYNVLSEAKFGAQKHTCTILPDPPFTPNFQGGDLTQGVMAIEVILEKFAYPFAGLSQNFDTDYLIVYRPTSSDPWVPATYTASYDNNGGSGPNPVASGSGVVNSFSSLSPLNTNNTNTIHIVRYDFNQLGEYAVRNNGIRGVGCNTGCAEIEFRVNFYDATQFPYDTSVTGDARFNSGPPSAACLDCNGAL